MKAAAIAFLLGSGFLYLVLLLLPFAWWPIALFIAPIVYVFARKRQTASFDIKPSPIDLLTIVVVIAYARYALSSPPLFVDFWAIWGLKGRVFFEMRGIDWRFLSSPENRFAHPDYPLLLPLNYAAAAMARGAWSDRWLGLFSVAFACALLLIVRSEAARDVNRHFAAAIALATCAFALAPEIGIADGPLIAFGTAALLMMRNGDMLAASLLLGFAASTKNEGLTLVISAAGAFLIANPERKRIFQLWPAIAIVAPWLVMRAMHHLPTDLASAGALDRAASRLGELPQIGFAMLQTLTHRWLWLALILSLAAVRLPLLRKESFLLMTVAFQFLFFVAAYLATPHDVSWHIGTSFGRISAQLGAPALYAVMVSLARTRSEA